MFKRFSKMLVIMSMGLILAAGMLSAGGPSQNQSSQVKKTTDQAKNQMKVLFVDENGDGICDLALDHDGDGIPNSQDKDWTRPQDGTGNKAGKGNGNGSMTANKNQFRNMQNQGLNKQSFRNGGQAGSGICDGSGTKGQSRRSGKK
jgi:hypothetical protein